MICNHLFLSYSLDGTKKERIIYCAVIDCKECPRMTQLSTQRFRRYGEILQVVVAKLCPQA